MSTFSSTVNSGASFIVRDIWQVYFKPHPTDKESVRFSYLATAVVVIIGLAVGVMVDSIAQIWNWMMLILGGGVIVPNVLRWYWWRMNGWGYAMGVLAGIILAIATLFFPGAPVYITFPIVVGASLIASIWVSLATPQVDDKTLTVFYSSVRPFGVWKRVRRKAEQAEDYEKVEPTDFRTVLLNVILGMIAISSAYLFPMYLVGHWYTEAIVFFTICAGGVVALKFTWYDNLPDKSRG